MYPNALIRRGMVLAVACLTAACAQGTVEQGVGHSGGSHCVDDSPRCINDRRLALDALLADRSRAWLRQRPTAQNYASGVRLFALKQKRRELTCEELLVGEREAADAGRTLRGPAGAGLSPGQISRGAMLGDEVARDLQREGKRRCRR